MECSIDKVNACREKEKICNPKTKRCADPSNYQLKKAILSSPLGYPGLTVQRCGCLTLKNTQCTRNSLIKSPYCKQHHYCYKKSPKKKSPKKKSPKKKSPKKKSPKKKSPKKKSSKKKSPKKKSSKKKSSKKKSPKKTSSSTALDTLLDSISQKQKSGDRQPSKQLTPKKMITTLVNSLETNLKSLSQKIPILTGTPKSSPGKTMSWLTQKGEDVPKKSSNKNSFQKIPILTGTPKSSPGKTMSWLTQKSSNKNSFQKIPILTGTPKSSPGKTMSWLTQKGEDVPKKSSNKNSFQKSSWLTDGTSKFYSVPETETSSKFVTPKLASLPNSIVKAPSSKKGPNKDETKMDTQNNYDDIDHIIAGTQLSQSLPITVPISKGPLTPPVQEVLDELTTMIESMYRAATTKRFTHKSLDHDTYRKMLADLYRYYLSHKNIADVDMISLEYNPGHYETLSKNVFDVIEIIKAPTGKLNMDACISILIGTFRNINTILDN
jgi:hypothetical protein